MLDIVWWIIAELFVELLFYGTCGWVGYAFTKLVTFGKVELDYGRAEDGEAASIIGAGVLLGFLIGASLLAFSDRC